MTVIDDVIAERRRQIHKFGWSEHHDDGHADGALAAAAACYVLHASGARMDIDHDANGDPLPSYWPWDGHWWKPKDKRRDLIRAAALIVAEIERLDRAAISPHDGKP